MASCYITTGYTLDCRTSSTGGISEIWILGGSGNTITGYTVTNSMISAIGGVGTWFKFELPKTSGSMTENLGMNDVSKSIVFQPEITINLPKWDTVLRDTFVDLVSQFSITVLVRDNNNRYWIAGIDNGLMVSAGSLQTGTQYTDGNQMNVVLTGGEPTSIREVDVTTTIDAVFVSGGFTFQS